MKIFPSTENLRFIVYQSLHLDLELFILQILAHHTSVTAGWLAMEELKAHKQSTFRVKSKSCISEGPHVSLIEVYGLNTSMQFLCELALIAVILAVLCCSQLKQNKQMSIGIFLTNFHFLTLSWFLLIICHIVEMIRSETKST